MESIKAFIFFIISFALMGAAFALIYSMYNEGRKIHFAILSERCLQLNENILTDLRLKRLDFCDHAIDMNRKYNLKEEGN